MATPKVRISAIAKEHGLTSKEVLELAQSLGFEAKSASSGIEDYQAVEVKAYIQERLKSQTPAAAAPVAVEPPSAPPMSATRAPGKESRTPPPLIEVEVPAEVDVIEDVAPEPEYVPEPATVELEPIAVQPATELHPIPAAPAPVAPAAEQAPVSPPPPPITTAPPARPAGRTVVARPLGTPSTPAARAQPPVATPPPEVRVTRTATASPIRPGDVRVVSRDPIAPAPRRTGEILGRKEITVTRPPAGTPPGRSAAGTGGSGLIPTRMEGGRRTFIMTGRGRTGPGFPGGGGFAGRGAPNQGPPGASRGHGSRGPGGSRESTPVTPKKLEIELPITVKSFAEALGVKANVLIQKLFVEHKRAAKINDILDQDTVELLGLEFHCEITFREPPDVEAEAFAEMEKGFVDNPADLTTRSPIVTVLGHVDHGKTSLLDAIRTTVVASKEHGGITQHIGASLVKVGNRSVVFLDTPGHKAFTEMRARGAQVTDVVVLVVAADDGVMPQTKEAIAHARAAKVPIVVAMNKCDLHQANTQKVKQELTNEGLQPEEWGGDTGVYEVSALTKQGIPELLERLALESDVLELKANPKRSAFGTCLEAEQSRGEGNAARILIQNGTLRKGDIFVCGVAYGRVRAIKGDSGKFIPESGPATPVEITGLNELPRAGDRFFVLQSLEKAKEIADARTRQLREQELAKQSHVSLENLFEKLKGDTLKIILKTDVTGSLEVLKKEIIGLAHPEIRPEIIHAAVGGITETDVTLADASDAVILGFHVSADLASRRLAEEKKVEIRLYQVIYKLTDELRDAMEGRLAPESREKITGRVEVRQTWKVTRLGVIAGCMVIQGVIKRASKVRVSRGGIVIHDGTLASLKRFKDDAKEVVEGFDCGVMIERFDNLEPNDTIEAYEIESIKRTFES